MVTVASIRTLHLLIIVFLSKQPAYTLTQKESKCDIKIPKVCDYIIVGAGAAGAVIASRLSEDANVIVCLFEAGKKDTGQPSSAAVEIPRIWSALVPGEFTWNYTTVPQLGLNGREIGTSMGTGLGGSTTHNGMAYFRGFKADYDNWAAKGATGWSYTDVLPFFLKSENNVSPFLNDSEFHGRCGPLTISQNVEVVQKPVFKIIAETAKENKIKTVDCNEPTPIGICQMQLTIKSGKRESTSTAFLRPFTGRKNLLVFTETLVEKILISKKEKRAYGIRFLQNGQTSFANAKREIILSGGSIETPKLLQRSGVGPASLLRKLRVRPHAILSVGENYHDHAALSFDLSLNIETTSFKSLMDPSVILAYNFRRTGLYAETSGTHTIFLKTKHGTVNWPDIQLFFNDGKTKESITGDDIKSKKIPTRTETIQNGTSIYLYLSHPKSRGTIQLRSLNTYDPPLINPRIFQHKEDILDMIKGIRSLQRIIKSPSMTKAGAYLEPSALMPSSCKHMDTDSDTQWMCILRNLAGVGLHPVSTCKMGAVKDPSAVVDPRLRVKGIKRLRVADASIMPEVTSVNTQGPVIMIGEKAADIIQRDYILQYDNRSCCLAINLLLFSNYIVAKMLL